MGWGFPDIDWPDLPANPEQFIRDKVIELLNYLGYPWPTTSPEALRSAGSTWSGFAGTVNGWVQELEGGVSHLTTNNSGPGPESAIASLSGSDSNLDALRALAEAVPTIAQGYNLGADVVIALRLAVIAEILLDILALAAAIVSGGVAAGASFLVKQGAGAVIDYLIDQAINQFIGGA